MGQGNQLQQFSSVCRIRLLEMGLNKKYASKMHFLVGLPEIT